MKKIEDYMAAHKSMLMLMNYGGISRMLFTGLKRYSQYNKEDERPGLVSSAL